MTINELQCIGARMGVPMPFSVKLHTRFGGYLEYSTVERMIAGMDTAKWVAEQYLNDLRTNDCGIFIGVTIFENERPIEQLYV